jgi:hypothetical protein
MRAESAVEPTRSENITVTWRRSALALRVRSVSARATGDGALVFASARRTAMASSSFRRCPTMPTPRSFKSSAVKLGRTTSSIACSRNATSYCPRPRLRSQPPTSITAALTSPGGHGLHARNDAHKAPATSRPQPCAGLFRLATPGPLILPVLGAHRIELLHRNVLRWAKSAVGRVSRA